ncbi:MAG: hypothetical protein ACP5JF_05380 [Candidatus Methanodesulfokora sp.]|nr:MAG: hypothetical protein C0200_02035 [Candidatus Korarchaeota archaeon]
MIEIRRPKNQEEFKKLVKVQIRTWNPSVTDAVGHRIMKAIDDNGGIVLGAFDEKGDALGYSLAFLAEENGKIFFYSHHTAVVPEMQGKGIGFLLKLAQREEALRRGIDLIKWTFDPLRSVNSHFNIRKLGAVGVRFLRDYYGEMSDEINRGMRSDRMKVEWHLRSRRVENRLKGIYRDLDGVEVLGSCLQGGLEVPVRFEISEYDPIKIKIPEDLEKLRGRRELEIWRDEVADLMEHYMGLGYIDVDFRDNYHILTRRSMEEVLSS